MEKLLIDATELDKKLEILMVRYKAQGMDRVAEDYNFVRTMLLTAPTVDAVEVVRCSSCQHSTLPAVLTQRYGEPGTLTCHNWKSPCNKRNVKSDGFCPYGERRTDG